VDGSFWAANEYTTSTPPPPPGTRGANWGTWVSRFTISATNSNLAAALPPLAQSLTMSGAQVETPLFTSPLGAIAATSTAGAVPANGVQADNHTAPMAFNPDSVAAWPRTSGAAQIAGETIGALYFHALDSPTEDSSSSWIDREFLDDLNLAWI